ncbi:MAG: RidA family protein [Chloroflexi bacterium]|nr:MAG: RidA family protein [Chloroflexota bacterium]
MGYIFFGGTLAEISKEQNMEKTFINPGTIAPPLSNYSHAVRVVIGDTALINVAGQVPLDPNGNLVGENDITKQTQFVFEQISTILKAAGGSLSDVVKANIYVTDMSQYAKVAEVRNRYFAVNPPGTTFVEVSKLVKEGFMVEIEVQAAVQL